MLETGNIIYKRDVVTDVFFQLLRSLQEHPVCSSAVDAAIEDVLLKKCVLKNFANITGKHLCCSLVIINFQALAQGLQLDYKETATEVFSCKSCEIVQMTYFEKHLRTTADTCKGFFPNISAAKFMLKMVLKMQCSLFV